MSANLLPLDQQWSRAVATYTAMMRKSIADGLRRQAINLLYLAAEDYAPVADPAAIRNVPAEHPKWPAHIVNEMKRRNYYLNRKGAYSLRRKSTSSKRETVSGGFLLRLEVARSLREGKGHRNERAAQLSEKLLRARGNAVQYVRGFFAAMVRSLGSQIRGPRLPGIRAEITTKENGNETSIELRAVHYYRGNRSPKVGTVGDVATWVNAKLAEILQATVPSAIADMEEYWRTHAPKGRL